MKCPESIEELQELEKLIPLCKVTLYDQAKARIEKGVAKSVSEASRQIAEETGKPEGTIRRRIQEEQSVRGAQLSELSGTAKHTPLVLNDTEKKIILKEAKSITKAIQETKRAEVIEKLESISAKEAKAIEGVYDVIVIDPPWPMEKIERDERPNQTGFDYPTMNEEELNGLNIPSADSCHVWLWTTHKFLPMAFRLLERWDLKYVCCFTWHKPGGIQPFGLPQYNSEFCLYARKGSPVFVDTKAFNTCFEAPRGKHSEKPEYFYEMIKRVTAGRRIDMFGRREIDGWDSWGNEIE